MLSTSPCVWSDCALRFIWRAAGAFTQGPLHEHTVEPAPELESDIFQRADKAEAGCSVQLKATPGTTFALYEF